jgi:hypothetical protein
MIVIVKDNSALVIQDISRFPQSLYRVSESQSLECSLGRDNGIENKGLKIH